MKVKDAKALIQHIAFSDKESRLSAEDIKTTFPELVTMSKEANPETMTVYRVLGIPDSEPDIRPFFVESVSKDICGALQVADKMPQLLWGRDSMISVEHHYHRLEVTNDRIIIDFNVVMPILEERLKNVLNHSVKSKDGTKIKISSVIDTFWGDNEFEAIINLEGLEFDSVIISKPSSHLCIAKSFRGVGGCSHNPTNECMSRFIQSLGLFLPSSEVDEYVKWSGYEPMQKNKVRGTGTLNTTASVMKAKPAF
ncbi:hypothetical protein VCHA53O466_140169 [Vibrio chagasii]|nr:hypothetical protein VCHA53O466_140169 [Vibrio chagasii]